MSAVAAETALRIEVRCPEDLGAAWQRLWHRVPQATPFASPAWLLSWTRHYAARRCRVATATCAGELVACLPMFWWQRSLLLAGTGPSDHGDALIVPGLEHCAGALLHALVAAFECPVDRIELRQLPRSSALLGMAAPRGWGDQVENDSVCPFLAVAGNDGMAQVGKRMRRNWRYALHAIARAGGRIEPVRDEQVGNATRELERLHALRWAERGGEGVLADPLLRRLLADAGPELANAGMLRLHRVRVGEQTVAVLFALHGERRTCCYLSGFDPAFAKLSPVTALVGATIAQAARERDLVVDFLRGEEPYKYGWGATAGATFRRLLVPA